ncbi:MAG: tetratricopeptide repeat protein [Phycisphaeraceae bacterium]|nr:tetratricopeptide repeat protein [Phycisphaeraceae bacterium]
MAAKVNTKFVAILVGALVLLAGGVGAAAYMVLFKSAADLVKQGDALMAANKPKEAEKAYGKAVNKEATNLDYLRKWQKSLENLAPETQTQFDSAYPQYLLARKRVADLLKTDVQAHRDHLDLYLKTMESAGYSRQFAESLAQSATDALSQFGNTSEGESQTLRRYRALANLRILTESKNLKDSEIEAIKADFEAALAADPADVDSIIGLHNWYIYLADNAMNHQRMDQAVELAEQGRQLVRDFRAKDPNEPRTKLLTLGWMLADAKRQASGLNKVEDRRKIAEQLRKDASKALDETAVLMNALDPAQVSAATLSQFVFLELQLDDTGKLPRSRALLEKVLAAQPNDAALLIAKSEADALARDYESAIATLQRVRDLPNPKLGVPGRLLWYRKNDAMFRQAALSLKALDAANDADPAKAKQLKAEWLEKAKEKRAELAKIEPESSARMLFVDGKLKLAQEDYAGAQQLLLSYLNLVNDADPDALVAAANASFRLNQPGKARDLLMQAIQISSANVQAIVMLAEVELRLKNTEAAERLYESASDLLPDNAAIKARRSAIAQELGRGEIDDPVARVIAESRKRKEMGDEKGAAQILQEGAEKYKYDAQITQILLQQRTSANDVEGAKALIRKALEVNTNEDQRKGLQSALQILESGDATMANITAIDLAPNISEVDRMVMKLGVYSNGGDKYKDAAQSLAVELEQKYADEPIVMETLFLRALRDKKVDAAQQIADKAIARNVDKYEGATFKARLQAAQGRRLDAIATLTQASQRFNFNVEAWRVLSALQVEEGRFPDAAASMQKALALRPDDPTSILQYSATLQAAGKPEDALRLMQEKAKLLAESNLIRDEWLRLEGSYGDKEVALSERERDLARDPSNRTYMLQAAALSTDLRRWDDAKRRIQSVRQAKDGLDIAMIAATWSAGQSDLDGAEKTIREYANKVKTEKDGNNQAGEALMSLARFMVGRGRMDRAIAALEEARPLQDPKRLQVDRMLAELYLEMAETDKAIETLRGIANANKDDSDDVVRLRLAEALIQARRFDEAEKELQLLSKEGQEGPVAMLLRADSAMGKGDSKAAMQILDRAVTAFSSNAGVFLKRAQAAIETKRNVADILADLDQVIRLDPRLWQAHQLRAVIFQSQGRKNDVINEIKAILQIDPTQDEILGLGLRMLVADDRDDEAVALAEDVAKRRGAPGTLYANIGDLFDTIGRKNRALSFYRTAFDSDSRTSHAVRYVNALLAQKPPNITEAENVLKKVQSSISKDPELLLVRASVRRALNQLPDARKDASASMKLLPEDQVGAMQSWFQTAFRLLGPKELATTLDAMSKEGINPEWIAFFQARLQSDDPSPATRDAGISAIQRIAESTTQPGLASLAARDYSGRLYLAGQFEKAADAMKAIIRKDPNDADTMNNLAYLLGKDLGRPADGIEFAEKATQLKPKSPEILDTLGLLLMQTGKLDEAQKILDRAIAIASSPSTQVTILLHMSELQFKQGKKDEAKVTLGKARSLFQQVQGPTQEQQKQDLERLEKLYEGP